MKVVFDIETTGLNPKINEILQFSAINEKGEVLLNTYVQPVKAKEWKEAEKINGITYEMVKDAPGFDEIRKEVQTIFDSADELIAYNGSFDMEFLEKNGVNINQKIPYYDVMKAFAHYYGEWSDSWGEYKWQKLSTCAAFWGFKFEAHDSLEDVKATLHAYNRLQMPENGFHYLEEIWENIPKSYVNVLMRYMNDVFNGEIELKDIHELIYDETRNCKSTMLKKLNEMSEEIANELSYSASIEDRAIIQHMRDVDYCKSLITDMPEKKIYYVEIKETLSRVIPIAAQSKEEAKLRVEKQYDKAEIILDSMDHADTEFKVMNFMSKTEVSHETERKKNDGREIE